MNRDIKFRGIAEDGDFVYGDLLRICSRTFIVCEFEERFLSIKHHNLSANMHDKDDIEGIHSIVMIEVKAETIGQYTVLKDKNGNEIYEGDILQGGAIVEWFNELTYDSGGANHSGFYCKKWFEWDSDISWHDGFDDCKIIGNIHQNPELLT